LEPFLKLVDQSIEALSLARIKDAGVMLHDVGEAAM